MSSLDVFLSRGRARDAMISLVKRGEPRGIATSVIGRIVRGPTSGSRSDQILCIPEWRPDLDTDGYAAVLCETTLPREGVVGIPLVCALDLTGVGDEDVVEVHPRGDVHLVYRRHSPHNTLLATEACNSLCLMCSQPPRQVDPHARVADLLKIVRLISPETQELGISGGEPTLLKDGFIRLIAACRDHLPRTAVHVLSNGRLFYYGSLAVDLAEVSHPDLMVGIPLYSDQPDRHDHVVQVRGAFDETMIGLQNLGRVGVPVEIRVVIHKLTYDRLPDLAEYIYRNLTFASHVAFMGLEQVGFAVTHHEALWIDPADYTAELEASVTHLASRGMQVSIYNHQLCTVPEVLWQYCRRSISDWKNEFLPVCDKCAVRAMCGGFFSSVVRRRLSRGVGSIQANKTVAVE